MMKSTMKRMVLTGAAVAVMMSFAAPAMAEEEQQLKPLAPINEDTPVANPDTPGKGNICERVPGLCSDDPPVLNPDTPDKADPVVDPPVTEDPPVADPPEKQDPANEESDNSGSGGSSGDGGGIGGSASETVDRGGTFVSSFLPYTLTSTIGEAGNSVKENLPASVATSLPNTGGGWSFLVLVAAGLIAGGFLIRSIARRTSSATRTAQ